MVTIRRSITITVLLALFSVGLTGCGGGSNEEVYLHVFNGYPGSSSMSLFGPSGTVASNLSFGRRTQNYVPVDRNLGTQYTMTLQGAPKPFQFDLPLYNLYPQESATLFFKRRTGADTFADPILYRHIQTGFSADDRVCRLNFDNALSLKNDGLGQFNYAPILKINPACTGYVEKIGTYSEENSKVTLQSGQTIQVGRPNLLERINAPSNAANPFGPWFLPAEVGEGEVLDIQDYKRCDAANSANAAPNAPDGSRRGLTIAGPKSTKFVWVGRNWQDNAEIDFKGGTARVPLPTRDYMNCIGWNPDKPAGKQKIKSEQVARCRRGATNVRTVSLDNEVTQFQFTTGIGLKGGKTSDQKIPQGKCGFQMIVASDFFNQFVERSNDDAFVGDVIEFNPSQYYFWVLYGRPVDPLFEKWGANTPGEGGGFVTLPPYPGNPEQKAGDTAAEGGGTTNSGNNGNNGGN